MDWKRLLKILKGHNVWIQTHNFPDPDAIASAYGLQYFLAEHEISSKICYKGHVDKISVVKMLSTFEITLYSVEDVTIHEEDYVILVDGQRYNANLTELACNKVACIDHHPVSKACDYEYKDIRVAGSCATLIAQYLKESATTLNTKVASALTYGMKVDTDSLNRGVTKLDIQMYQFLFEYTDSRLVRSMYNNSMELADLRAYGAAIENVKIYGGVGMAHIPFDCEDALIAMVADFILKLDTVTIAVIYAERNGGLKFSVRSVDSEIDAGTLTRKALSEYGEGGGHASMAGGYVAKEKRSMMDDKEEVFIKNLFIKVMDEMRMSES